MVRSSKKAVGTGSAIGSDQSIPAFDVSMTDLPCGVSNGTGPQSSGPTETGHPSGMAPGCTATDICPEGGSCTATSTPVKPPQLVQLDGSVQGPRTEE